MQKVGWVKIYRKIQENWIWLSDEPYCMRSAWDYLLLNAYFEDAKITRNKQVVEIKRGQMITSLRELSQEWKWSTGKVTRFLNRLEKENMIIKEDVKNGTLLTIVNYEVYQDRENTNETVTEHQRNSDGTLTEHTRNTDGTGTEQERNTIKEDKENNNINNIQEEKNKEELKEEKKTRKKEITKEPKVYFPKNEALNQTFLDFIQMRKEIKKPMSERAIELAIMKLDKMTSDDDTAIKILEQSIMNSWQGLFPLNESRYGNSQQPTSKAQQKLEESREMMRKWAEQED